MNIPDEIHKARQEIESELVIDESSWGRGDVNVCDDFIIWNSLWLWFILNECTYCFRCFVSFYIFINKLKVKIKKILSCCLLYL
jgi:hypothetical protein